jgi:hypothetical protein
MAVSAIYAQLACSHHATSVWWFATLFDRPPDATPMAGLAEWHLGESAGFQLFEQAVDAGHGTLTLYISDLSNEHTRLTAAGLNPGDVQVATTTRQLLLRDPDDNLVVLVTPL